MFKVYKVGADHVCYRGYLYIGAESVEEARKILEDFIRDDYNDNVCNSYAVDTSRIYEDDEVNGLTAERKGILQNDLFYEGH